MIGKVLKAVIRGGGTPAVAVPAAPVAAAASNGPLLVRIHTAIPTAIRGPLYLGVASAGVFAAMGDNPAVRSVQFGATVTAGLSIPVAGAMLLTATGPVAARLAPATTMVRWGVPLAGAALLVGQARGSSKGQG